MPTIIIRPYTDQMFTYLLPCAVCFVATEVQPANAYELERQQIMSENAARMALALQSKAPSLGLNQQDFSAVARSFVYGGAQKGTKPKNNSKEQEEVDADPAYEPEAAELANAEAELATNEMVQPIFKHIFVS